MPSVNVFKFKVQLFEFSNILISFLIGGSCQMIYPIYLIYLIDSSPAKRCPGDEVESKQNIKILGKVKKEILSLKLEKK